jgi:transposase
MRILAADPWAKRLGFLHPFPRVYAGQRFIEHVINRTQRLHGVCCLRYKVYGMLERLGNPLAFIVTAGQVHNRMLAPARICEAEHGMADKAYDADVFIPMTEAKGAAAVIAPRANRTQPREDEEHLYRERHRMQCLIHKVKVYTRIFSHFEKTAQMILSSCTWLSHA